MERPEAGAEDIQMDEDGSAEIPRQRFCWRKSCDDCVGFTPDHDEVQCVRKTTPQ